MAIIAVTYTYAPEPDRLDAVRPDHRAFLGRLHGAGTLVVSGPMPATDDLPAGALLLLRAADVGSALQVLDDDPFRTAGLVEDRAAREWVPVIGSLD